jgi:hypothetical protein
MQIIVTPSDTSAADLDQYILPELTANQPPNQTIAQYIRQIRIQWDTHFEEELNSIQKTLRTATYR